MSATDLLGILLIIRFTSLGLQRTYFAFCAFVFLQLFASTLFLVDIAKIPPPFDYRTLWAMFSPLIWVAKLCVVYSVLQSVLHTLPGLLRRSRQLLNGSLIVTSVVASYTATWNWHAASVAEGLVNVEFVLDRVISTAALIALAVILAFVLWFPVKIPKNLVTFSLTFLIYFAAEVALLFARPVLEPVFGRALSAFDTMLLGVCFLFWIAFVTPDGRASQVTIGPRWEPAHQKRLLEQLEIMNSSLLRQVPRS